MLVAHKETKKIITDVTTTTLIARLAGFIVTPGMGEKISERARSRLADHAMFPSLLFSCRNSNVLAIVIAHFRSRFSPHFYAPVRCAYEQL
jgi:hypothetical protein